jgi:hypothetical protein
MSFQILSDISKQYLLEEDAVKGFRAAVENGQSRLALQILADVIDAFMEIFVEAFEDSVDQPESSPSEPEAAAPAKEVAPAAQDNAPESEEKPKQTAKKETKAAE